MINAVESRPMLLAGLLIALTWTSWHKWRLRPVHPPDGQIAEHDPLQTAAESAAPIRHGRWTLTPRAHYDITARILGREPYAFDLLADLIPEDLALGWGPMSDNRVLAAIDISQSARFYTWRPHDELPIAREDVIDHSANTHVIPVDDSVQKQLAWLRVGEVVRLTGTLVDARRDDGARIQTSLTRNDSGAGACEVLLVESVERQ
jgi:hypothetical protein